MPILHFMKVGAVLWTRAKHSLETKWIDATSVYCNRDRHFSFPQVWWKGDGNRGFLFCPTLHHGWHCTICLITHKQAGFYCHWVCPVIQIVANLWLNLTQYIFILQFKITSDIASDSALLKNVCTTVIWMYLFSKFATENFDSTVH